MKARSLVFPLGLGMGAAAMYFFTNKNGKKMLDSGLKEMEKAYNNLK